MSDGVDHAAFVDAWLERSTEGLSPELRLQIFEASLGALWTCASTTLGDVTLTAIVDRVLYNAAEKFPFLSSLKVELNGGVHGQDLRKRITTLNVSELTDGIRFVLAELLTVIGNLTAEILTDELHAALSNVALGKASLRANDASTAATRPDTERIVSEGKKS
jgi:hypothetical protein